MNIKKNIETNNMVLNLMYLHFFYVTILKNLHNKILNKNTSKLLYIAADSQRPGESSTE